MKKLFEKTLAVVLSACFVLTSIIVTPLVSYADEDLAEATLEAETSQGGSSSETENIQVEDPQTEDDAILTEDMTESDATEDEPEAANDIIPDIESGDELIDEEDEKTNATTPSGYCGDDLIWEFDGVDTLTISGTGPMTDYGVAAYNIPWNEYKGDIKKVIINEGVTTICQVAFWYFSNLTEVTLPDGLTSIGQSAFMGCSSLSSITIPKSVTDMNSCAIGLAVNNSNIDNPTVDVIEGLIVTITGYKNTAAEAYADTHDFNFVALDACGDNLTWEFDGVDTLTISGTGPMTDYGTFTGDIPWSQYRKAIKKLIIGEGVTSICQVAFWYETNLSDVTLPETLTSIGQSAFLWCTSLSSIYIPKSVNDMSECGIGLEYKRADDGTITGVGVIDDLAVTITGYKNTAAETYADTYDFNFVALDDECEHDYVESSVKQATTAKNGKVTYTCTLCDDKKTDIIYMAAKVDLEKASYAYTGKSIEPAVMVYDSEGGEIASSNYDVAYTNNKKVGTATATVTFKNYYKGSLTADYTIVPATPATPKIAAASTGLKLTWTADTTITGYQIYRSVDGGKYSKLATISDTATTSYTDTTTVSGSAYAYKIRAYKKVDGANCFGSYSTPVSYLYLSVPASLKATNNASGTKLTWTAVAGATGYYIYRSDNGGAYTKLVSGDDATSYTDTTAVSGVTYKYRIKAYVKGPDAVCTSAYCTAVTNRYVGQPVISKAANAASGVKIVWGAVSGATGYQVYRCLGTTGKYAKLTTVTGTNYTDTTAVSGKTYTYKIRAYQKVDGTSYFGAYSAVKTFVCVARPTISKITSTTSGKLYVKWGADDAATGYQISYATKSDFSDAITVTNTGSAKNTKSVFGLTGGKTYYAKVRSYVTIDGVTYYSAYSAVKSIKVTK